MKLIVVSNPDCFTGEAAIVNQLFAEGLEYFHVRKPATLETKLRRLLDGIDPQYLDRVALHQFHSLANNYGIKRFHFTEHHRLATDVIELYRLQEKGCVLSTSVHSIQAAQQLPKVFSYAFFGPVFNSISKQDYNGIVRDDFQWGVQQKPVSMIALGGIDAGNIRLLTAMQFDGAALLGALWRDVSKAIDQFKLCKQRVAM